MTHTTTRATLSAHYKAIQTRLNHPRLMAQPTIPIERVRPLQVVEEPVTQMLPPEPQPKPMPQGGPTFRAALRQVADKHALDPHDIIGPSRKPKFVRARQELYYLLRQVGYSYPRIGAFCGGRDHTTIMHGIQQHEKNIA